MDLYTEQQLTKLLANGAKAAQDNKGGNLARRGERKPVVRWVMPLGGETWLISEIDPDNMDRAFGLYDSGIGQPVLEDVSISQIKAKRGMLGLGVERVSYFRPQMPLNDYSTLVGLSRLSL